MKPGMPSIAPPLAGLNPFSGLMGSLGTPTPSPGMTTPGGPGVMSLGGLFGVPETSAPRSTEITPPQTVPQTGGLPNVEVMEQYIRQSAAERGIDPEIAVRVARSEGLKKGVWQSEVPTPGGGRETSYGPFQLLVGGGLGDKFKQTYGVSPADPRSWKQQIDFALNEAATGGWSPWYGAAKVGVDKWTGVRGATPKPGDTMMALNEGGSSGSTMSLSDYIAEAVRAKSGAPSPSGASAPNLFAPSQSEGQAEVKKPSFAEWLAERASRVQPGADPADLSGTPPPDQSRRNALIAQGVQRAEAATTASLTSMRREERLRALMEYGRTLGRA